MSSSQLAPLNATWSLVKRSTGLWVIEVCISITLTVLAFCGNLLVCAAYFKKRSLRTIPNMLVLNLAITDIGNACTSLLFLTVTLTSGTWVFGNIGCQIQAYSAYLFYAATLCTMSATSVNRYYMLCSPVKYRQIFTRKKLTIGIALIWGISCLFAIPPLPWVGWGVYEFDRGYGLCVTDLTRSPSLNIFLFIFLAVNICIISYCYVKVYRVMRNHKRRIAFELSVPVRSPRALRIRPEELNISKTLFVIICVYGFCFLPTFILGFVLLSGSGIPREAKLFSSLSIATASAANPLIYGVRNRRFRDAFYETIKCV